MVCLALPTEIEMTKAMHNCSGGCHCGRVKFEIEVPSEVLVQRCSCSICQKSGYLHLIVSAKQFNLLRGEESLVDYRFHTGVARHLFCGNCGIKSFYVPRSHPDSFSINLNCIDLPVGVNVTMQEFDGRNWSKNREKLG
jgi:hypothetical protein